MTTVFFTGDPIAPRTFTEEATRQEYFPEWVINGSILTDVAAFGRTYDQRQWAHAFGITGGAARIREEEGGQVWKLHEWYHGKPPAAKDTYGVLWFQPAVFYAALQAAGPKLTPETFRDGLFAGEASQRVTTNVSVSWGRKGIWPKVDYNGVDDFTLIWWDPQAEGPDEIRKPGKGLYQFVDGGKRYLLGEFPKGPPKMFEPAGAVRSTPRYPQPSDRPTTPRRTRRSSRPRSLEFDPSRTEGFRCARSQVRGSQVRGTSSPSLARRSRSNPMISGEHAAAFNSCSRG